LDEIRRVIKAEWDLILTKTRATSAAVGSVPPNTTRGKVAKKRYRVVGTYFPGLFAFARIPCSDSTERLDLSSPKVSPKSCCGELHLQETPGVSPLIVLPIWGNQSLCPRKLKYAIELTLSCMDVAGE
jgi:hypothetical protein